MKTKALICALAAITLATPGAAFAQHDRDDRRGHDTRGEQGHGRDRPEARRNDRPGPPPRVADRGRGAGPEHNFYRGGRLPPQWRSRQYVVDDWRGHRLSAPPRGYHWVQTGGDYVLVAIATGVIASIFLSQ